MIGDWDAGGFAFSIRPEGEELLLSSPDLPPGYEARLTPAGVGVWRVEGGPYSGAELWFGEGGPSIAGVIPLTRLPGPPEPPPGAGQRPPQRLPERDAEHLRLWESIEGDPGVELRSPPPVHDFLQWLTERDEVLFHGSNDPSITEFLPRRRSMELGDPGGRGNLGSVYATHVALWAMFFAVVDRTRLRGTIRSGVATYHHRRDGSSLELYRFSIAEPLVTSEPFTSGTVYVLPREGFRRVPYYPGGPPSNEWACPEPVAPIARVPVSPADFPFQVGGHDDGAVFELDEMRDLLLEGLVEVRALESGFELIVDGDRRHVDRFVELHRQLHPDVSVSSDEAGGRLRLTLVGPDAFVHTFERRLRRRREG